MFLWGKLNTGGDTALPPHESMYKINKLSLRLGHSMFNFCFSVVIKHTFMHAEHKCLSCSHYSCVDVENNSLVILRPILLGWCNFVSWAHSLVLSCNTGFVCFFLFFTVIYPDVFKRRKSVQTHYFYVPSKINAVMFPTGRRHWSPQLLINQVKKWYQWYEVKRKMMQMTL